MGILERLGIRTAPTEPKAEGVPRSESGRGHDLLARPRGGSVGFVVPDEYKVELQGQRGFKAYDQMFRSDPDVRRSLMMLGAPIVGATWEVEAFGGDHANEAAQEQAEFIEWCLFDAMRPKWAAHIMQAWRVLRYGNAPFEQVYRKDKWQPKPKPAPEPAPEEIAAAVKAPNPTGVGKPPTNGAADPADASKRLFQKGTPDEQPDAPAPAGKDKPADPAGAPPEPKMIQGKERDVLCIDQLHLKLPRTVWRYESLGERLLAIHQLVIGGEYIYGDALANSDSRLGGAAIPGEVRIPAQDLLFYRLGAEGDNWEGESLLRPVHKPWKFKEALELVEAIGHERYHVGMPVGYPPSGASDDAKAGLNEVLGKIRSNETGHIMMPGPKQNTEGDGWLIEILTPDAAAGSSDIRASIEGHRDGISAGLYNEFMRLGQGAAGSKGALATASVQQDPFYSLIEAFISVYIEDPVNEQLVTRLWELNFSEKERKEAGGPPKLSASKIDALAADALAAAIAALATGETPIIFPDDQLEDSVRERLDLPPADPKARAERKAKAIVDDAHAKEMEKAGVAPKPGDAGEKVVEMHEPLPMGGAKRSVETTRLSQGALRLDQEQTGAMVALVPTPATAGELAIPGGEAADQLHVTLAFLGAADRLSDDQVQGLLAEVRDWARVTGQINGRISGHGVFAADPPVTYLSFDAPALPKARQALVDRLDHAGVPAEKTHGFTPHMTVAYGDVDFEFEHDRPLRFHQVEVRLAGRRFTFPFTGRVQLAAAPAHLQHVDFAAIGKYIADARVMVRELVADAVRGLLTGASGLDELTAAFEQALHQVAEEGAAQVRRETGRLNPVALTTHPRPPKRSLGLIVDVASGAASAVASSLDATRQRLGTLGTPPEEAAKRLGASVSAAADREARDAVTLALNAGRMSEAEALGPDVRVIYTSILDENRCEWCEAADDGKARKLDDPIRLANRPPNPNCYGWTRCRCIEVYTFDGGGEGPFALRQGYDPHQPRDPGGEHGGQWTKTPGGSGRGPSGKLRNFSKMKDAKLAGVLEDLHAENDDPEAIAAAHDAAKARGWDQGSGPSATVPPASAAGHADRSPAGTEADLSPAGVPAGPNLGDPFGVEGHHSAPGNLAKADVAGLPTPIEMPVPSSEGHSGRSGKGGLRNFKVMKDAKLAGVIGELIAQGNDPEAMVAALTAAKERGWSSLPGKKPAAAAPPVASPPAPPAPPSPSVVGLPGKKDVNSAPPMRFEQADISQVPKFINDPGYVFQQKIDGIRAQLVLSPHEPPTFRSSSGGTLVSTTAAKTTGPILAAIPDYQGPPIVIDGEVLDGKFHVFDLVQPGQENRPYLERQAMADAWVKGAGLPGVVPLPTAKTAADKQQMYDRVYAHGGEGVMMKRADSPYTPGARVKHTLKAKFRSTVDAVILERNRDGHENFILGLYDEHGNLKEIGSSSAIGKPDGQVGDVIEVAYLYAMPGTHSIVQPSVVKLRPDKQPQDATVGQLRFVDKSVLDEEQLAFSSADPFKDGPTTLAQELRLLLAAKVDKHGTYHDPGGEHGGQFASKDAVDEGTTGIKPSAAGTTPPGGGAASGPGAAPDTPAAKDGKGSATAGFRPATSEDRARLKYPPGWSNVRVNPDPDGALQAAGTDRKGRSVTLYSQAHHDAASAAKFAKLRALHERMPAIVAQLEVDAADGDQAAVAALLIQRTGLRPGSTKDTKAEAQAYGASTLKDEHVEIDGEQVTLTFTGKHGVPISVAVEDQKLANVLQERLDEDPGGDLFDTDDAQVRKYLAGVQEGLRPKDFRTYLGTATAHKLVRDMPTPEDEAAMKKAKKDVATQVSKLLGNTPTVALASYIDPAVFSAWAAELKLKVEDAQTMDEDADA